MKNLAFIFLIIGVALLGFGVHQYEVSDGADAGPTNVRLSEVERIGFLNLKNITIDAHLKVYPSLIYSFSAVAGQTEAKDFNRIRYSYYPVVSLIHPYAIKIDELTKKYGGVEKIPNNLLPELSMFSILVKTADFQKKSDLPTHVQIGNGITGIITNDYSGLSQDEKSLLLESFPKLDLNRVYLLDQGLQPIPSDHIYILIGGGVTLLLIGLVLFLILIFKFLKILFTRNP